MRFNLVVSFLLLCTILSAADAWMIPSRTRTAFAGVLFGKTETDQDNHLIVGAQQSEMTNVGMSTTTTTDSSTSSRKPGVASASELQEFIAAATAGSDRLLIADVRNPNLDVEPVWRRGPRITGQELFGRKWIYKCNQRRWSEGEGSLGNFWQQVNKCTGQDRKTTVSLSQTKT